MAVNFGEVATPEEFVLTIAVAPPPANVPLAPEVGALKVTLAPEIKLPLESFTVATNGFAKARPTSELWPPPDTAVMLPGGPALFSKAKDAGLAAPVTVALTV